MPKSHGGGRMEHDERLEGRKGLGFIFVFFKRNE